MIAFVAGLFIGATLGVFFLALFIGGGASSACNQTCNQGRDCTCAATMSPDA